MATVKKDAIASGIKQAYAKGMKACPTATVDIHINLKNRNHAIKEYGYGPLNPESESRVFWQKKAEWIGTTILMVVGSSHLNVGILRLDCRFAKIDKHPLDKTTRHH